MQGSASAKAWAQAGRSTTAPRLCFLAHCEGEPGIIVTRLPPGAPGAGRQAAGGYCGHSGLGA